MSNRIFFLINIIMLTIIITSIVASSNNRKNEKEKNTSDVQADQNEVNYEKIPTKFKDPLGKSSKVRSFSKSQVFSYSYSNDGKSKPQKHIRNMETEEYFDKDNDKPAKIRKYGELLKKDNQDPAILKRKAASNVEQENLLLGDGKDERTLSNNEFKAISPISFEGDLFNDGFFGSRRQKNVGSRNKSRGLFRGFNNSKFFSDPFFSDLQEEMNPLSLDGKIHGKYDKFLNEKIGKLSKHQ